ncbi:MAG TPA: A/G-specific adenine glycosylase [Candidatus Wunengus californicus]|uniref:A/G-specific adenine glycosylase n=1 Tax=Candidatus Wunengus californicus TaxID=3367619 RepID=UPI0040271767
MVMKEKCARQLKKQKKGSKTKSITGVKNPMLVAIRKFQQEIYRHYSEHGRKMPWRMTYDPYCILVSEIMLQQTQVQRVMGKYEQFTGKFPDFPSLARSPLRLILREWQGLGYNRRAIALKQIAQRVVKEFHGNLPASVETLTTFPGIGRATASAITAFAFHEPTVFIETNIRRVFIHCFFHDQSNVKDAEILPLVEKTLDTSNPREWYYALMDYGVMLKQKYENPNRRSAHYQRQSPFQGSNRQVRGMILKVLTRESCVSEPEIVQKLQIIPEKVKKNLNQLLKEGFIKRRRGKYTIA